MVQGSLPVDRNGNPIPVLGPGKETDDVIFLDGDPNEAHTDVFTENAIVKLVSITGNFHVAININATASSANDLIPQGVPIFYPVLQGERVSIFGTTQVCVTRLR